MVASLRVIAPELPFEVKCMEITENAQTFSFEGFRLEAFKVNHNVLCLSLIHILDTLYQEQTAGSKQSGLQGTAALCVG